jgi:hypothetical protein
LNDEKTDLIEIHFGVKHKQASFNNEGCFDSRTFNTKKSCISGTLNTEEYFNNKTFNTEAFFNRW